MKKLVFIVTGIICLTFMQGCQASKTATDQSKVLTSEEVEGAQSAAQEATKEVEEKENLTEDAKTENENDKTEDSLNDAKNTAEKDTKEISLYVYGPDDYENPVEIKEVLVDSELYDTNLTDALNQIFADTDIRIQGAEINTEERQITVDLSEQIAGKFNEGSCSGVILTNELIDTLVHLPDIDCAVVTVEGQKNTYGDHYSFEGVFERQ